MKIGIIVHSHTGNTYSVAQRLSGKLAESGHTVCLDRVAAENEEEPQAANIRLQSNPDISAYDAVIFGAPVHGFSLSAVMSAYLSQISSLKDKKVLCWVTHFFPFAWMGGNQALKQMIKICDSKGAQVAGTGVINWSRKNRSDRIEALAEEIDRSLK